MPGSFGPATFTVKHFTPHCRAPYWFVTEETKQLTTSQYKVISVVISWLQSGWPRNGSLIPGKGKRFFLYLKASRMALGTTQPPAQWVPGTSFLVASGWTMKLSNHVHVVPKIRMSGINFMDAILLCFNQSINNQLNHCLTWLHICVVQASYMFQSFWTIIRLVYKNFYFYFYLKFIYTSLMMVREDWNL